MSSPDNVLIFGRPSDARKLIKNRVRAGDRLIAEIRATRSIVASLRVLEERDKTEALVRSVFEDHPGAQELETKVSRWLQTNQKTLERVFGARADEARARVSGPAVSSVEQRSQAASEGERLKACERRIRREQSVLRGIIERFCAA